MNIVSEYSSRGKTMYCDIDAKQARLDHLKEMQLKLESGEITPEEATKASNKFAKKHKMYVSWKTWFKWHNER